MKWYKVEDDLPEDEVRVLCFHEPSKNYFISYRTKDCLSGEPKWWNGDRPTHWQELTEPVEFTNSPIINGRIMGESPLFLGEHIDHWIFMGTYFGYPECCIEDFCTRDSEPTPLQEQVHDGTGFIPCPSCCNKILSGETTLEGLISNRRCKIPFPKKH